MGKHIRTHIYINLIWISVFLILQSPKCVGLNYVKRKKKRGEYRVFIPRSIMGVLAYFQVIKYKLCRCVKKKHKGRNNNDRGAVLSLDDVKRHVSRPLLSPFVVSNCIALTGGTLSSLSPLSQLQPERRRMKRGKSKQEREEIKIWRKLGRERHEREREKKAIGVRGKEYWEREVREGKVAWI